MTHEMNENNALSTRPAVTFPAKERHRPLSSTKLYCLVTEAHRCTQFTQGYYAALSQWELIESPVFVCVT